MNRFYAVLALAWTLALGVGLAEDSRQKFSDAFLLEGRQVDWCHGDCAPIDRPTLYFCVRVDNQILIGKRGADWIWNYDSSRMFAFQGKPVRVRYTDRAFWIVRPDGQEIRVQRDNTDDVDANDLCSHEVRRYWLAKFVSTIRRPSGVPAEAALVPTSSRSYFWVRCQLDSAHSWNTCAIWDQKGVMNERKTVNAADEQAVPDAQLHVDVWTTKREYELHLTNGIVLVDWRKARVSGEMPPNGDKLLP